MHERPCTGKVVSKRRPGLGRPSTQARGSRRGLHRAESDRPNGEPISRDASVPSVRSCASRHHRSAIAREGRHRANKCLRLRSDEHAPVAEAELLNLVLRAQVPVLDHQPIRRISDAHNQVVTFLLKLEIRLRNPVSKADHILNACGRVVLLDRVSAIARAEEVVACHHNGVSARRSGAYSAGDDVQLRHKANALEHSLQTVGAVLDFDGLEVRDGMPSIEVTAPLANRTFSSVAQKTRVASAP